MEKYMIYMVQNQVCNSPGWVPSSVCKIPSSLNFIVWSPHVSVPLLTCPSATSRISSCRAKITSCRCAVAKQWRKARRTCASFGRFPSSGHWGEIWWNLACKPGICHITLIQSLYRIWHTPQKPWFKPGICSPISKWDLRWFSDGIPRTKWWIRNWNTAKNAWDQ